MLRIGLIGVGYWGPNILRNLLENENVEVSIICDTNKERLIEIAKKFKLEKIPLVTDYNHLEHSDADAYIIATPAVTHFEIAFKLLSMGKHCLIEKPLAMNTADALMLIDTATYNEAKLATGHVFLFNSYILKIKELIKNDKILYMSSRRLNMGRVQQDINAMWSLGPHDVSICNFLMGDMPKRDGFTVSSSCFIQNGVEDVVFLNLKYPENRTANIHVSWIDPVKTRDLTIVTDKKMIYFDDVTSELKIYDSGFDYIPPEGEKAYGVRLRTGDINIPKVKNTEPLREEINAFISWILGGPEPVNSYYNGSDVVEVLDKAHMILKSN